MTGTLSVLEWAGYDAEDFWVDFKNAYPDVTVNFEIGISDADIYAKMAAGNQADVFHPYSGWLQFYVDEGLVEEIDTSKLTNWDKVSESHKKLGQINGKQYFIPWDMRLHICSLSHGQDSRRSRFVGGADGSKIRGSHLHVG